MPQIETLAEALEGIAKKPWSYALFVEDVCPWKDSARCVVLDPDDSDDPDEDPPFAKEHDMKYALTIQGAQSVVKNLKQQMPNATPSDLVRAFNFYVGNDAFIEID